MTKTGYYCKFCGGHLYEDYDTVECDTCCAKWYGGKLINEEGMAEYAKEADE